MVKNKIKAGFYFIIFTFALFSIKVKSEMLAENVVVAVNCGGDSFTDSRGITYEKVFRIFTHY